MIGGNTPKNNQSLPRKVNICLLLVDAFGVHQTSIGVTMKPQKPGNIAQRSGQYEIIGQRGGQTGQERTVSKGEPLPPTPKPGQTYKLVDPTKHGKG